MTEIPAESYETGRLTVGDEDFYAAEELVRAYHANRSICLRKQYLQNIYRIVFVVMLVPLACYFISEFFQPSISPYMAIISTVYTVFALFFVLVRKELLIPGIASLVYLAEAFRLDDPSAIIPTAIPAVILCVIGYRFDRDKRWLEQQPGYPKFHDILVYRESDDALTERDIPPLDTAAEDPYKDILSDLQ